jgi:hypothetical protein
MGYDMVRDQLLAKIGETIQPHTRASTTARTLAEAAS